jgi:hypothetical protein
LVWGVLEQQLERADAAIADATAEFRQRFGDSPILEMVGLQLAKNLKRAKNTLR